MHCAFSIVYVEIVNQELKAMDPALFHPYVVKVHIGPYVVLVECSTSPVPYILKQTTYDGWNKAGFVMSEILLRLTVTRNKSI